MKHTKILLLGMIAGPLALPTKAIAQDPDVRRAREILEMSAQAYKDAITLQDKISYSASEPGSKESKNEELSYAFGPNGAALVKGPSLQAVAVDSKLYLTRRDVPDKYVVASYEGDFAAALNRTAGKGSIFEPPPLVLHSGKGVDAGINALRFNLLDPLRIAGHRHLADGKPRDEIHFVADNGELTLTIDAETHFFSALAFQVRPSGAPEGFLVRVKGTFSPEVLKGSEGLIGFAPGRRSAVASLADLTSKGLAIGSVAPDFELETLDGKKVALHDLRASVVVLDFWASWCTPCWAALKETEALSKWAADEKLPVVVFAINTSERGSDSKEIAARAGQIWKVKDFKMPTLLDSDSQTFKAYGNQGLPSVVLISASGTILNYQVGLVPEMLATLKSKVQEGLSLPTKETN
jgi:thiol-disulfide isomerase/thioredoxin